MQSQIIFRERQELPPSDLNDIETFVREAIDTLVSDAVGTGTFFSGFDVAQTNSWELTVGAGRRYAGGQVFTRRTQTVFDLFPSRPLSQKKIVALVSWGQTIETDVQVRDFVIDVETGETEPQSVAMQRLRSAELQTIVGSEAAQPQRPNIPADNVVVAFVTIGTGGVETIEMQEGNRVPQLARQLAQILDLIEFQGRTGVSIERLKSDLFSVAQSMALLATRTQLDDLRDQLRATRDVADRALAAAESDVRLEFVEYFLNELASATESDGYAARIDRGLHFPRVEAVSPAALTLANPNDPLVSIVSGRMTPVSSAKTALDNAKTFSGAVSLLGYTTTTQTTRRVPKTRQVLVQASQEKRIPISPPKSATPPPGNPNPSYADILGNYPATRTIGGVTYTISSVHRDPATNKYDYFVYRSDAVYRRESDGYREVVDTVETKIVAQGRAQTFIASSAGRLKSLALFFERVANAGDVTVLIAKADGNNPDQTNVVAETTIAAAALTTSGPVVVPLPAEYVPEGRYSLHVLSNGDHRLRLSGQSRSITQGEHYAYTGDNEYIRPSGESDRDIAFRLEFQAYSSTKVVVGLNPVSMAGGMDGLVLEGIVDEPAGTDVSFEAQIAGQWQVLDLAADRQRVRADFSTRPDLVPLRAVFEGTLDKMPSIFVGGDITRAIAIQRAEALRHVSEPIVPSGGQTSHVRLAAVLSAFMPEEMSCDLGLVVAGATVAATAQTVTVLANGDTQVIATFDLPAPIAGYQAVIDGSIADAPGAADFVVERLSHFVGD